MSAPIMMVEDDENSAVLTHRLLKTAGIKNELVVLTLASNAILYLEKETVLPVLILLDLGLPDLHGIDFLKYIRNHERLDIQRLCVFILTISDDQETVAKTIETGANAFLRKNLNIGQFLAAVQSCGVQLDIG